MTIAAPKILNIDQFTAPKRVLVIAGERHPILPLNVQQFIDNLQAVEQLEREAAERGADTRMSTQIKESVAAVRQAVPTLSEEQVTSLPIEALTAILEFIRGDLDPGEQNQPAADTTDAGEGPAAKNE